MNVFSISEDKYCTYLLESRKDRYIGGSGLKRISNGMLYYNVLRIKGRERIFFSGTTKTNKQFLSKLEYPFIIRFIHSIASKNQAHKFEKIKASEPAYH